MEFRWADAIALFDNEPETSPASGLALGNKGQALLALDRFPEAEQFLRRSLDTIGSKGCPHAPSEVQFRRSLAEAVGRQGRWGESLPLFDEAAARTEDLMAQCPRERHALRLQQAHVFNASGSSYLHLRRWKGAVEQYEKVREIYRELGAGVREGYAETLTNSALALTELEDFTPAELALKEALDVARASGDDDQVFRIKIAAIKMKSSLVPAVEREQTRRSSSSAGRSGVSDPASFCGRDSPRSSSPCWRRNWRAVGAWRTPSLTASPRWRSVDETCGATSPASSSWAGREVPQPRRSRFAGAVLLLRASVRQTSYTPS